MPRTASTAPVPMSKRGVFAEQTVGGAYRVAVVTAAGVTLLDMIVDASVFSPRFMRRLERWLDKRDPRPQLAVMS